MPSNKYVCGGWACTDCLILLANGEDPVDSMTEAEISAWHKDIRRKNRYRDVTLGLAREEHACTADFGGMTAGEAGGECDCETRTFSSMSCDHCGSTLAGERHAISFFKRTRTRKR